MAPSLWIKVTARPSGASQRACFQVLSYAIARRKKTVAILQKARAARLRKRDRTASLRFPVFWERSSLNSVYLGGAFFLFGFVSFVAPLSLPPPYPGLPTSPRVSLRHPLIPEHKHKADPIVGSWLKGRDRSKVILCTKVLDVLCSTVFSTVFLTGVSTVAFLVSAVDSTVVSVLKVVFTLVLTF